VAFVLDDLDNDNILLSYFDGASQEVLWTAIPVEAGSTSGNLFADSERIYFAHENRLFAHGRADGALRWQVELSDRLPYSCDDCLMSFGDVVVLLTYDGLIRGLSAANGSELWQSSLDSSAEQLLRLDEHVGLMHNPDELTTGLEIYDPRTGELVRRIEPLCISDFHDQEPDYYDPVVVDPPTHSILIAFGFFDPGCVQRWDYRTGEQLSNSFTEMTNTNWDAPLVVGEDAAYLLDGSDGLFGIAIGDGATRHLATSDDYELTPLAEHGEALLVKARNHRGTQRDELWAIHNQDGEVLWKRRLATADTLFDEESTQVIYQDEPGQWSAQATDQGIILLQALHDPARLTFETLSWADGTSGPVSELSLPVSVDSSYWLAMAGWDDNLAWLNVDLDQLWAVDGLTGRIVARWP
jgi:hypothetical protein